MSVSAQNVTWSFAPQPAFLGDGATFTPGDYTWRRHKAISFQGGTMSMDNMMGLELGGRIVPTIAYKTGHFGGAGVELWPRLENTFGLLLEGALGNVSSVTGLPVAGMRTHVFRHNPSNELDVPWIATRTLLPGNTSAEDFVEYLYDAKINSLRILVPAANKLSVQVQVVACDSYMDDNPGVLTYENTFEEGDKTPDSGRGSLLIGGDEFTIVAADIMINNGFTRPQDEMIVGSFRPESYTPLNRSVVIRFTHKYNNSSLYQDALTGSPTGNRWDSIVKTIETAGDDWAFDLYVQTPGIATGSTPYGMRVRANKVVIAPEGPPQYRGGTLVYQNYVAVVHEPVSGDYIQVILENLVDGVDYQWL